VHNARHDEDKRLIGKRALRDRKLSPRAIIVEVSRVEAVCLREKPFALDWAQTERCLDGSFRHSEDGGRVVVVQKIKQIVRNSQLAPGEEKCRIECHRLVEETDGL